MPIVINEIVEVSYRGTCFGQRVMLVNTWRCSATTSASPLLQDLADINTAFTDVTAGSHYQTYRDCISSDFLFDEVRSQVIHPSRSLFVTQQIVVNGAAGATVTPNLQAAVTRVSNAAGRKGQATSKLGPLPTAAASSGLLSPTHQNLIAVWGAKWITPITAAAGTITLTPCIFHGAAAAPVSTDIVAYRTHTEVRDMTRRVVGRGE